MKKITLILLLLGFATIVAANENDAQQANGFDYYYNHSIAFDDKVTQPQQVLGHQVGEWHVRPDQSFAYFQALAASSDKVVLQEIGRTHENRPLITAFISSQKHIAHLEQIKNSRQKLTDYEGPNIVWLGYSVHGNEASGANAALLVAYRLAASQEPWVKELLEQTIVMIDPMLNPDGLDRFANWVNRYKGKHLVADSDSIEHNEDWPMGRTNHYWFDLNRDWLLLQHPESKARVKQFYQWRPHIVGDFHEMGTNATYFFQPGVPSRQHPLTSLRNFELTNKIAKYHAKALDEVGVSYYSKESFDDFYYGKGSTFPDINGGIGILFEQASARGHVQESIHGDLSFPFAIRNQVATSFSTLKASVQLKDALQQYQRDFFSSWPVKAAQDLQKAVVFSSSDHKRLQEFIALLKAHQIEVKQLAGSRTFSNKRFPALDSYAITFKQPQYGLIKAMFESRTAFADSTFYDVSAWTFPLAFNLNYAFLDKDELLNLPLQPITELTSGNIISSHNSVALIMPWDSFAAATALTRLLQQDITVKLAEKPFTLKVQETPHTFAAGSLIIPLTGQAHSSQDILKNIEQWVLPLGINLYGVDTGLSIQGIDLGSPNMTKLALPKPLLLIGDGVSPYEAGEVWHLLDSRLELPLSMQYAQNIESIDLARYSHLLLVNGRYPELTEEKTTALKHWINKGGTIVATRNAVRWLIDHQLVNFKLMESSKTPVNNKSFAQRDEVFAKNIIGGAIYQTQLDLGHPLTYGITIPTLALTKSGTQVLKPVEQNFVTVASYLEEPLAAGYSSQLNIDRIKGTPAILAQGYGNGSIILFNDNPNFRGYWMGAMRVYINSLFFSVVL